MQSSKTTEKTFTTCHIIEKTHFIEINTADTSESKKLKGIGSVLSARIVKFRDVLGGFHSIEQIKEIYGISEETYISIKDKLTLSYLKINKLNINQSTVDELAKHPYISKKQAQALVNYRNQHGAYSKMNNLTQNKALDKDFLCKIEPYLEFN